MSAVDKSNQYKRVTVHIRDTRQSEASDSKTNATGLIALIPQVRRYPLRSKVVRSNSPKPAVPLHPQAPVVDFDTFLERAVHSVQRDLPSGKSRAMKWSMKVAGVGEELRDTYNNKHKHQIRKLFASNDSRGVKELIKEMANEL